MIFVFSEVLRLVGTKRFPKFKKHSGPESFSNLTYRSCKIVFLSSIWSKSASKQIKKSLFLGMKTAFWSTFRCRMTFIFHRNLFCYFRKVSTKNKNLKFIKFKKKNSTLQEMCHFRRYPRVQQNWKANPPRDQDWLVFTFGHISSWCTERLIPCF